MGNNHLWVWQLATPTLMHGLINKNWDLVRERDWDKETNMNKMSELQSYEVQSIVWGYHVYGAVWKAPAGQILPFYSERKATPTISTLLLLLSKVSLLTVYHIQYPQFATCTYSLEEMVPLGVCMVTGTSYYFIDLPKQKYIAGWSFLVMLGWSPKCRTPQGSPHLWSIRLLQQWLLQPL